jgi:pSer/pThr/pTyr-binding forkhead associated (FHA) protein
MRIRTLHTVVTREDLGAASEYLAYEEDGATKVVPLERDCTRLGRSLAADVRLDDASVSPRHALIVRQSDGVRVLDDRSLDGIFVNGARVDGRALEDGDEIAVGRYRMRFGRAREATSSSDWRSPEPAATSSQTPRAA